VPTVRRLVTVFVTAQLLARTNLLVAIAGEFLKPALLYPLLICRSQPGHQASDCTEPRSAEGVECKRCNEGKLFSNAP
jgi:hypothetical protein